MGDNSHITIQHRSGNVSFVGLFVVGLDLLDLVFGEGHKPLHLDIFALSLGVLRRPCTNNLNHGLHEVERLKDQAGAHYLHNDVILLASKGAPESGQAENGSSENVQN